MADWTTSTPATLEQSLHLRTELFNKIPQKYHPMFINDSRYATNGFAMLHQYLQKIDFNTDTNRLNALEALANLEFPDSKSAQQLLSEARGLAFYLRHLNIDTIVAMMVIKMMEKEERCTSIVSKYKNGDPTVVGCSMTCLGELIDSEEDRLEMFKASSPEASARRAKPPATPTAPANPNPPKTPTETMTVANPPVKGVSWKTVGALLEENKTCPVCFSCDSFHLTTGCPVLAQHNKILTTDEEGAKAVSEAFAALMKAPPPDMDPLPSSTSSNNPYESLANQYVDNEEIPSDFDDDAAFDHDFSTNSSINPKAQSTSYTRTTPSARGASSQHTYTPPPIPHCKHITSSLAQATKNTLSLSQISSPVKSESEACADSGATDTMLPDKKAFISYRLTPGKFVSLGDGAKLEQRGVGSAKISLNGKIIILRNVLHVPSLQDPLYSLCRHQQMPGCGYISLFETGSHLLFPNFILELDTTFDSVLSYRSVGHDPVTQLDYAEPHTYPSAKPATLIPPDDVDARDLATVKFYIPDPKARYNPDLPLPAPFSPPPTPKPTKPAQDDIAAVLIHDNELIHNSKEQLTVSQLSTIHHNPSFLPPIPPAYTPGPAEKRTTFDTLKLHRIFGCRCFRNQNHLTTASANATLIHTGKLPASLGDFTTINEPPRSKPLTKLRKYLDKVHMDIVFGNCLSLGGFRYAILLVDVATRYTWIYCLQTLTSNKIVTVLQDFCSDANGLPKTFHSDFDQKLIGGKALRWIKQNSSGLIATPSNRQSSNGLVERTWQSIVRMARAYTTEKQVGREYWWYAVQHASHMKNQVPGRLGRKLTSPFELVYGTKADSSTWFELFSVGFFAQDSEDGETRTKTQAQTLAGIVVGRDHRANTVVFYSPLTKKYYRPPTFKLNEGRLPITVFPQSIWFEGGISCGLIRNSSDPAPEPFLPGTRITLIRDGKPTKAQ
eukprot:CCRYP_011153-RA/>CCRYP_011153-RA protein AED:0.32 eAED:0.22 QI:0/0/0/1/1/1/2/0/951